MKKNYSLFCIFCLSIFASYSQTQKQLDSLEAVIPTLPNDSAKLKSINLLTSAIVDINPTKSIRYANIALNLAKENNYKSYQGIALINIGNGYYNLADYKASLNYYLQGLKIQEGLDKKSGILSCSGAIGNVYLALGRPDDALKYFERALKIGNELGNKNAIASCLISIGTIYSDKKDLKKALDYYFKSLDLFVEVGNDDAVGTVYNNIADSYLQLKDFPKSLIYINKALELYNKTGSVYGQSLALNNIGDYYNTIGEEEKAIEYYKRGLAKGKEIDANEHIIASYKGLSKAYKNSGKYKDALVYQELLFGLNDSIYNKESSKQMAEMQTRFDSEKKEQEISLLTKDKKIQDDELNLQSIISKTIIGVGALLLLLTIVAIRGYNNKRKANRELGLKNQKIETAYNIIEDQHKEIKDSIAYAKRIQETILPPDKLVKQLLPDSFILYRPKDIVSGDFYWIEPWGNNVLFAAVDCTGHGVPGALMSVVGVNLLNKALNELGLSKPALILNSLSKGIGKTLRQTGSDSEIKDGMDLALCSIDFKNLKLEYAGVFNPLWIIRDNEIIEVLPDKNPIGTYMDGELKNYSNDEIDLKKGDAIYIFTDGYADQFGGPKGKKFKYKPLQQLLLQLNSNSMTEQLQSLNSHLNEWKGNLEQVDDILMIGVRV